MGRISWTPEKRAQVAHLREQGYTFPQIAEFMDAPLGSVRSAVHYEVGVGRNTSKSICTEPSLSQEGSSALLAALWREHPRIMRHLGAREVAR